MGSIALGRQHLVELYGCCPEAINNVQKVRAAMIEAAQRAQASIVADVFHEFNPHGISGVVVIAESHLAVHSWPEHGCVSIDIFTCSDRMNPELAIAYLSSAFKAKKIAVKEIDRGTKKPMDERDFEGTVVLESLAAIGKVDEFFDAIDADDFVRAKALMKQAGLDAKTVAVVLKQMAEVGGEC